MPPTPEQPPEQPCPCKSGILPYRPECPEHGHLFTLKERGQSTGKWTTRQPYPWGTWQLLDGNGEQLGVFFTEPKRVVEAHNGIKQEGAPSSEHELARLREDGRRLDYLAQHCYLPGDHPDSGLLVVVGQEYAPLGAFNCNQANDAKALRAAIDAALATPAEQKPARDIGAEAGKA